MSSSTEKEKNGKFPETRYVPEPVEKGRTRRRGLFPVQLPRDASRNPTCPTVPTAGLHGRTARYQAAKPGNEPSGGKWIRLGDQGLEQQACSG